MIELYEHNEEAYLSMQEMFEYENKVAIVHPTGTGKMYIALKWLYENKDKSCLFLCPTKAIMYQLKNTIESCGLTLEDFPNLKLALYRNLLNWNTEDYQKQYDYIVLDEFHRAGAPLWGECVNTLLEHNEDSKVLGLSATPTRYVDHRNMVDELFEGNVASEITLAEAIARNILPFPTYVNCVYSLINEINKREEILDNVTDEKKRQYLAKLIEQAKRYLQNVEGIKDIVKKYVTKKDGKYLIFCKDINHIYEMQEEVLNWFKGIGEVESYIVHSDIESEENEETLKLFEQPSNKIKLLFSVDMLNEGLHVDNVDGELMLRTTDSHIIYLQQLGRCLKINGKLPLVMDIANNIEAYENIYDVRDEILDHLGYDGYNDERIPFELKEKFKIYGYAKDIIGILKQIDFIYNPPFNKVVEIIREYLETTGKTYGEIKQKEEYKGIKIGTWINNRRIEYKHGKLSKEKEEILRELGEPFEDKNLSFEEMIKLIKEYIEITGKTYEEIKQKEEYEGIKIGYWKINRRKDYKHGKLSKEKEDILRELGETFEIKENLSFEVMIKLIKEYMEITGKRYEQIKQSDEYKGIKIGRWKDKCRQDYRKEKLSKEKEMILRSLGETFKIRENLSFEEMIEIIKEYMEITGKTYEEIKQNDEYKEIKIGQWKSSRRYDYKRGKLSEEEEMMLINIGETFEDKNLSFEVMIRLIKEYLEKTGKTYEEIKYNEEYKGIKIGKWKDRYRVDYKKGRLSKEKEEILRELGETFENKNLSFEEMIGLIKEYLKITGKTYEKIKSNEEYKGIKIGNWKNRYRKDYRKGILSKEKELALRELGETFPNVYRVPKSSTILVKNANLSIPSKKR